MKKLITLLVLTLILLFLTGCPNPGSPAISFPGFTRSSEDIYDGFLLTFDFTETPVGTPVTLPFSMANTGSSTLVITDMTYYLLEGSGSTATYTDRQTVFSHSSLRVPSFPVLIEPQSTYDNLFPVFNPDTCGIFRGILALSTNLGTVRIRLTGTGQWRLTLKVNGGQNGSIVRPVAVAAGETVEYLCTTSTVTVESAPTNWLYGLQQWVHEFVGAPTAVISDAAANITTVTLSGHATLRADFLQVYLCVDDSNGGAGSGTAGDPYQTIQQAIAAFTYPTNKGIVVAGGTYTLTANLTLPRGTFWGGYNGMPTFNTRNITTYVTTINLATHEIQSGADSADGTDINGFTINGGTLSGSKTAAVKCTSGSKIIVSNNIITAPVEGYAVHVQNASPSFTYNTLNGSAAGSTAAVIALDKASPVIGHNTITAGNGTVRSAGIFCYNESSPAITDNTITAGNSTAADGESAGIYIDWFCDPVITGNTITGGTASGADGASYGIYNINSSSPVVTGNTINGGSGAAVSFAFYNSYGGRPVINDNMLFTAAGSERYGLFSGPNGRFASLKRNNLYDCTTAFVWIYLGQKKLTTIDEVNETYVFFKDDNNVSEP